MVKVQEECNNGRKYIEFILLHIRYLRLLDTCWRLGNCQNRRTNGKLLCQCLGVRELAPNHDILERSETTFLVAGSVEDAGGQRS